MRVRSRIDVLEVISKRSLVICALWGPLYNIDHLREVIPAEDRLIGQRRRNDIYQAPRKALARFLPILRKNRERRPGKDTEALALLLPVVHIAEEEVRLRIDVVIDAHYILVLIKNVSILEWNSQLIIKSVRFELTVKASPVSGCNHLDERRIVGAELPRWNLIVRIRGAGHNLACLIVFDCSRHEYLSIPYGISIGIRNGHARGAAIEIAHIARAIDRLRHSACQCPASPDSACRNMFRHWAGWRASLHS